MRFRTVLLVGAVLAALLLGSLARTPPGHTASSLRDSADDEASEPTSNHAETFPYEVAARFNEGIVANIDAIDTALTPFSPAMSRYWC
ncbi:MAG: hypothetical protein M3169_11580 [Candidatus Eremiobacteraeota bacterium]|nr:hypothetical protein [Candidatus Eremiobacteraeota bacterium]